MMIKELSKLFAASANPVIASKKSAYMRNLFPFLGLTTPCRELLEKSIIKKSSPQDLPRLLLDLWDQDHREFHYSALALAQRHKKTFTPKILPTLEFMIRNKSWWDTVDTIAPNIIGHLVKTHPELTKVMDRWIEDPYLWIRRAALLHQLRYKKETDEERLFSYCKKTMHEKEFFIRKAIGWVLREYSKTHPHSVKNFLRENPTLSNLSIREASKYL
jgi:3-methyladenine DNA glycosylase AlkD